MLGDMNIIYMNKMWPKASVKSRQISRIQAQIDDDQGKYFDTRNHETNLSTSFNPKWILIFLMFFG
jgi:hypothetical protein